MKPKPILTVTALFALSLFLAAPASAADFACIQVITFAQNPDTGDWETFPTPCDVPEGWRISTSRPDSEADRDRAGAGDDPEIAPISEPGVIAPPPETDSDGATAGEGDGMICAQVVTYGRNPDTGAWVAFPTPCDVPEGWDASSTAPEDYTPIAPPDDPGEAISASDPFGLADDPVAADLLADGAVRLTARETALEPGDRLTVGASVGWELVDLYDAYVVLQSPDGTLSYVIGGAPAADPRADRAGTLSRFRSMPHRSGAPAPGADARLTRIPTPFRLASDAAAMGGPILDTLLFPGTPAGSYRVWLILTPPGESPFQTDAWAGAGAINVTIGVPAD